MLHLLRYFYTAFEGECHRLIRIDDGMIDCRQPKVIIKFNGHLCLFCQCGSKGTDAVILFLPALPFCLLFLHFLIAASVALITLHILRLVLCLDGVFLNALANQFTYDLHILCQGDLLCVQFCAIA